MNTEGIVQAKPVPVEFIAGCFYTNNILLGLGTGAVHTPSISTLAVYLDWLREPVDINNDYDGPSP